KIGFVRNRSEDCALRKVEWPGVKLRIEVRSGPIGGVVDAAAGKSGLQTDRDWGGIGIIGPRPQHSVREDQDGPDVKKRGGAGRASCRIGYYDRVIAGVGWPNIRKYKDRIGRAGEVGPVESPLVDQRVLSGCGDGEANRRANQRELVSRICKDKRG